MKPYEARQFVQQNLSERAIILQLAEEASELAAAANKLVRVLDGENPSPVTPEQARLDILEEFGDILNCMDLIVTPTENIFVGEKRAEKCVRWAVRIMEKRGEVTPETDSGGKPWADHFERRFDKAE